MVKMRTIIFLACSLIILSITISCNNSSTGPSPFSTDVFPNALGNTWTYAHHDSLANVSDTLIVTITGETSLSNNQPAMIWQYRFSNSVDTTYVFTDGDTVRFVGNSHPFRIVFPLSLGSEWKGDYWFNDTIRVLKKEPISVVAATFLDSYKIEEIWIGLNDYGRFTWWFVPSVGFVRIYHTGVSFGTANETFELISYSIR